jgi:hypothetical protein
MRKILVRESMEEGFAVQPHSMDPGNFEAVPTEPLKGT